MPQHPYAPDEHAQDGDLTVRPRLGIVSADAAAAVEEFAAGLQAGNDRHDAEILNRQFATDVAWGSPYGALVEGYEQLHPIHVRFQRAASGPPGIPETPATPATPAVRYQVRHVLPIGEDVIVAHIARLVLGDDGEPAAPSSDAEDRGAPFSELAMYVLVRRDGKWWLAAGQNTPMRPGGALPAS